MRYNLLYTFLLVAVWSLAQSPHGKKLTVDCGICHYTDNWHKIKQPGFNHSKTRFPLTGLHKQLNCRQCHASLQFADNKGKVSCQLCHSDVHQGTTNRNCEQCHNTSSWVVSNVRSLHQLAGFTLKGAHATADCNRCHQSASQLRFDKIRTDCFACHRSDYLATTGTRYDHKAMGFDVDCAHCHSNSGVNWTSNGRGFNHSFFPLAGGHNLACNECHIDNNYKVKLNSDCISCHSGRRSDAISSQPAHQTLFSKYTCSECHSSQSWQMVRFKQHDAFWGIYSGDHKGKWNKCTDCHKNDPQYDAKNTCNRCHGDKRSA